MVGTGEANTGRDSTQNSSTNFLLIFVGRQSKGRANEEVKQGWGVHNEGEGKNQGETPPRYASPAWERGRGDGRRHFAQRLSAPWGAQGFHRQGRTQREAGL